MATKDTASVQEMHAWYMGDGRRSLASVSRQFDVPEEDLRTAFSSVGLPLKTAQPLRGAAAKNAANAEAKQNGPQRDEHPMDVAEQTLTELTASTIVALEERIMRLSHAREALLDVLGEEA